MKIIWDEAKNKRNIMVHGFDFVDAERVFQSPLLVRLDTREDYGEDRWQGIGMLDGRIVVVVIFTEPNSDTVRVISLRKATKYERTEYEKQIKDKLGTY